jgi:hypothetical protein
MQMNVQIPFSGVQPDFVNALAMGQQAAMQRNEASRINALAGLYQTQGADILAGNQNALNALAGIDPMAALGVADARQGMDARALQMDATRQDMRQQAEQWAAQLDERERAQRLAEGEQMLSGMISATSPQAWDAWATSTGQTQLVGQFGQRDMMINNLLPPMEALRRVDAQAAANQPAQPDPQSAIAKLQMDFNNGLITEEQLRIGMQNLAPTGMTIESTPGGGFRFIQGAGVTQEGFQPSDPALMIANIDGILNDPALPYATGADAWRAQIPGTEARRVGARMDQLQGQAFLQAFESLKGAGQITEIEGQKATQAIARLDRYQSQEDYVAALQELRTILEAASQRPQGWADSPDAQQAPAAAPVGQSQFIPSSGLGTPATAPTTTVNANGPAVTGPITADTIRTMQPMQLTEFLATTDVTTLPTDVLLAIVERAQ